MNKEELVMNLQNITNVQNTNEERAIKEACALFTKRAPIMKDFPAGTFPCCPHCGNYLPERHYKHCPDCGQLINWIEYKEENNGDILKQDISSLDISTSVYCVLTHNNINTIEDLLNKSITELMSLKHMTLTTLNNIVRAMKIFGANTYTWEYVLNKERD